MARRLRQVTDLYITGKVAELIDGSPAWVQTLNPFEQDTARNEGQIAKARITLALKEFGSEEQAKVRMFFFEDGLDGARNRIIDAKMAEAFPKMYERIANDPEWKDRLRILERGLEDTALNPESEEQQLIERLATEYTADLQTRLGDERVFLEMRYADATEESLWAEYLEWYIDRRAGEIMLAEYRLHQIFFGARWCDAVKQENGTWDHTECAGHNDQMFANKADVRTAPEALMTTLIEAADEIEMTIREAKNSDRQGSSSDSSPLPSAAAESTASTPEEIPVAPRGSSSSPSLTPSPSSVTAS